MWPVLILRVLFIDCLNRTTPSAGEAWSGGVERRTQEGGVCGTGSCHSDSGFTHLSENLLTRPFIQAPAGKLAMTMFEVIEENVEQTKGTKQNCFLLFLYSSRQDAQCQILCDEAGLQFSPFFSQGFLILLIPQQFTNN